MLHKDVVFVEFTYLYPNIKQKHLANFMLNLIDSLPMPYTSLISIWDCYALLKPGVNKKSR